MQIDCGPSSINDEPSKRGFQIPAAFILSAGIFLGPGLVYFLNSESRVALEMSKMSARIDRADEIALIRLNQTRENSGQILKLLEEVAKTQGLIRDTQRLIRATQQDMQRGQAEIIRQIKDHDTKNGPR